MIVDGKFENGVVQRHGRMMWPDGSLHLGEWTDGFPCGLGMHVGPNNEVLNEGIFCRGKAMIASSLPSLNPEPSVESLLRYRRCPTKGLSLQSQLPKVITMQRYLYIFFAK
jgi:hypothetical protein